jgi:hypothetical protein
MRTLASVPRVIAPTTDYPGGRIQDKNNAVVPAVKGTPITELIYGDIVQFFQRIAQLGSITPNNTPDNVTNGHQLIEALIATIRTQIVASLTNKGVAELSTEAEVMAGSDNERIVTPYGLDRLVENLFAISDIGKTYTTPSTGHTLSGSAGGFTNIGSLVFVEGRFTLNIAGGSAGSDFRIQDSTGAGAMTGMVLNCRCYIPSTGAHFVAPCKTINSGGIFTLEIYNINGALFPTGVNMDFEFSGFYKLP